MPFNFRQFDARARRLFAIGNACLAAGLMLRLFVHPSSDIANNWLHAVFGFLLGISIAINLSWRRFPIARPSIGIGCPAAMVQTLLKNRDGNRRSDGPPPTKSGEAKWSH
jgi:hypothetical protein